MIDSIIPVALIFIYLLIIFLINYYYNISPRKNKKYQIKLDDVNPVMALYCYNNGNANKLFWVTLLELVDSSYYKLYSENDVTYLKWNKKDMLKIDDLKLKEFEKKLVTYINTLIYKNDESNYISLDLLAKTVSTDWSFQSVLNGFTVELKKEFIETYGIVDKISIFKKPFIVTFAYVMQVLYFFNVGFNLMQILLLSTLITFVSLVIASLFKEKMYKYTLSKHIKLSVVSAVLAVIAFYIWKNFEGVDYIIFHLTVGFLTFMYPLLIVIDIYFIKTTNRYLNKIQSDIIKQIEELKQRVLNKENDNINYAYIYGLKLKNVNKDSCLSDYINTFRI